MSFVSSPWTHVTAPGPASVSTAASTRASNAPLRSAATNGGATLPGSRRNRFEAPSTIVCSSIITRRPVRLVEQLDRSEEHTSELQSHSDLVCRLLLEKKKKQRQII